MKLERSQNMEALEGANCTSKQKQRVVSKQLKKVVIERVTPNGLPPGWIKEIKKEKKSNGIRKDPYFTDPVSGYVFRSLPDALRYVETGDITRCAIKPRKRDQLKFLTEETSASLPSAANMQHLEHHSTKRRLFEGEENSVTSSLGKTDAEGLEKRQCTSVSADAMITSTPTTVILVGQDSLNKKMEEWAETKESSDPSRSPQPRTGGFERKQGDRVCAENLITASTPSSEMVQEEKLAENVLGNNSDRKVQIDSQKSKKKEAVSLPRRSSKRLAGNKPEMLVNLVLSERVIRAAARKLGGNEAGLALGALDNVIHGAPQLFETLSETEIADHAFAGTQAPSNVEQSNRSNEPPENHAFSQDQPDRQGTETKDDENIESLILNPFGDSRSDACLEFAVKTLPGTIHFEDNVTIRGTGSVSGGSETRDAGGLQKGVSDDAMTTTTPRAENLKRKHSLDIGIDPSKSLLPRTEGSNRELGETVCAEHGPVSTASTDMLHEEKLPENGTGKNRSRKIHINSRKSKKKEEVSLPRRSSNRLSGLNPKMAAKTPLSERVLRAAGRKSGKTEAAKPSLEAVDNVAHSASWPSETISATDIAHQAFTGTETLSNAEKKDDENVESQLLYPFEEAWSDPCLEFAFKTLTGEIPIEEISIQGLFEQQVDTSDTQTDRCLSLPEFGSANSFQSDFFSDFDSTGKPASGIQLPENPTFVSPGNVSLPNCSGNAPEKPSLEGEEKHQTNPRREL